MRRQNGTPISARLRSVEATDPLREGLRCLHPGCNKPGPKGGDRPYCLEHSEYGAKVMRRERARERRRARRARDSKVA